MQIRNSIRSPLIVAGVMAALLLGSRARAQVLDQVPSDALAVLKIKNVAAVSKKAGKMATDLGLDKISPDYGDPLGALEDKAHMGKGVDKGGDLALAMMDPDKYGQEDKAVLILVPVDDYKAFLGNFKATESVGELTKATPVEGDEDVYVAHRGKFAAMSTNKDLVAKKPDGIKLEGAVAKEAKSRDAILYANVVALRAKAMPELKKAREQIVSQTEKQLTDTGGDALKPFAPVLRVVLNEYMDGIEEVLNDTRGSVLGVNLSDEGVSIAIVSDFEPGSDLAKIAHEVQNTDKPLLAGLPDKKYFFVGGSVNNPETSARLLGNILEPIKAELARSDATKKFVPALDSLQKNAASTSGMAFGWVAPTGALGTESVIQQVEIIHGNAKELHSSQRQVAEAMGDLLKAAAPQQKEGSSIKIERDAKVVDGIKLDTLESKTAINEDTPEGAATKQILSLVYGPNGQTGVVGEVDAKTLLVVQGGSDQLIADSVAAAKTGSDAISGRQGIKAVAGELPKERAAVAYVDLGAIATFAIQAAKQQGMAINVKLRPNLPPIGMTAGSDGNALRFDVFIPNTLVQGLTAAVIQTMQQAKEGPGGGL